MCVSHYVSFIYCTGKRYSGMALSFVKTISRYMPGIQTLKFFMTACGPIVSVSFKIVQYLPF